MTYLRTEKVMLFSGVIFAVVAMTNSAKPEKNPEKGNGGCVDTLPGIPCRLVANVCFSDVKQKCRAFCGTCESRRTTTTVQPPMTTPTPCEDTLPLGISCSEVPDACHSWFKDECRKTCNMCTNCAFDKGFSLYNGLCLKAQTEPLVNWWTARYTCEQQGAYLVRVTDRAVEFIANQCIGDGITYWTGANNLDITGAWKWVNDNSTVNLQSDIWASNEPSPELLKGCGVVWKGSGGHNIGCARVAAYICQMDL